MLHSLTFINEYNADNREDQQKARRWQISLKIEWNLPHPLHTVLLWAIHSYGKKKGTEQIHSDIHLHQFWSSAHRAVRWRDNPCLHQCLKMLHSNWRTNKTAKVQPRLKLCRSKEWTCQLHEGVRLMTRFNPIWQPIAANSLWMSLMQVTGEEYGKTD